MFSTRIVRPASRFLASGSPSRLPQISAFTRSSPDLRQFSNSGAQLREDDEHPIHKYAGGDTTHEGSFSRTDKIINIEHPEEHEYPKSNPVQGRGGLHFKRTLASFTLEDRVGIVTGGARGLGLVMSQALVISGADVAIVDLNS